MLRDGRVWMHIYVDGKGPKRQAAFHIPRVGDTLRLSEKRYVKVTEIIWCYDEDSESGERVNIRTQKEVGS